MSKFARNLVSWIILGAVLVGFSALLLQRQYFIDLYTASQFELSSDMKQIQTQINLTDKGNFLLKASQAQLVGSSIFNDKCSKKEKNSVVLGCYIYPQNLYVYNVDDPNLDGVIQTTTAHEMLHTAYARLSKDEKDRINKLIDQALPSALKQDESLGKRLELYDRIEPGERYNELHSIIGTEVKDLPVELETYYKQYFTDRQIVVSYAAKYIKVMTDLQDQQDALVEELNQRSAQIEAATNQYNQDVSTLNNDIQNFNLRAQNGQFSSEAAFNEQRNTIQLRVDGLRSQQVTINNDIEDYNKKRQELLALNVRVKELNSKLDSTSIKQVE